MQGSVDQKEDKKGQYVGAGKAEVKVGNEDTAATVGVKADTSGKYVLTGNVKTDLLGGEKKDFQLFTDVKWPIGSSDVMLKPGFAAKYKLGEQRSLVFGSSVDVSTLTGLKNVEGYLEYRDGLTRLRFDANLSGIARERSLLPGQDVRFQVTLTLPLP